MDPALAALAAQQGGAFTRAQARDASYSERRLKTLTRPGGAWVVLRRGVYAERAYVETLTPDERYVLGAHAVALTAWRDAALSHTSAAALLGLPQRPRWHALHHLTRPGVLGGRTEHGVTHHRAALDDRDLTTVGDLRVTTPARTAVDVARLHGVEDGVVSADAALRRGATPGELATQLERCRCWPHNTRARAAVRLADAGAETIGESLLRLVVLELGIGRPETQYVVTDGATTAVADLRVGWHLFEFDGRTKYVGRERGGVADRPAEEVVWREKQREDFLRGLGFGVSRTIWPELLGAARRVTRLRLGREYAVTERRHRRTA